MQANRRSHANQDKYYHRWFSHFSRDCSSVNPHKYRRHPPSSAIVYHTEMLVMLLSCAGTISIIRRRRLQPITAVSGYICLSRSTCDIYCITCWLFVIDAHFAFFIVPLISIFNAYTRWFQCFPTSDLRKLKTSHWSLAFTGVWVSLLRCSPTTRLSFSAVRRVRKRMKDRTDDIFHSNAQDWVS